MKFWIMILIFSFYSLCEGQEYSNKQLAPCQGYSIDFTGKYKYYNVYWEFENSREKIKKDLLSTPYTSFSVQTNGASDKYTLMESDSTVTKTIEVMFNNDRIEGIYVDYHLPKDPAKANKFLEGQKNEMKRFEQIGYKWINGTIEDKYVESLYKKKCKTFEIELVTYFTVSTGSFTHSVQLFSL